MGLPRGVCVQGVSVQQGVCPEGWISREVCLPRGCLPKDTHPLYTEWLTDRCKNITLPQTSLVGGNNSFLPPNSGPCTPHLVNPGPTTARHSGLANKRTTDWRSNYDKTARIYPRIFYTSHSMNKLSLKDKDKLTLRYWTLVDQRGRQRRPSRRLNSFTFMQFSAKKLQNNRLGHPLRELTPLLKQI